MNNADLDIIREDITMVMARVQANKDNISSIAQKQTSTNELIHKLQASHTAMQVRIVILDEAWRRKNLKIRGSAESINDNKLSNFLRRLMSTLLHQHSAKGIQVDRCFRLTKSNK
ncbi:Hypothetical predicted protein, partial [Pelobates cultripes]